MYREALPPAPTGGTARGEGRLLCARVEDRGRSPRRDVRWPRRRGCHALLVRERSHPRPRKRLQRSNPAFHGFEIAGRFRLAVSPEEARAPRHFRGRVRREAAMTEEKKEQPKNVAVDLECDDEFEEFGNEGASRVPARVEISTRSVPEISSGSPHPSPFLTDPDPRTSPTDRVGRRGRGRRGCQAVGGGLGRHRRERRLHTPAEGGAGEAPVARSNRRA